MVGVGDILVTVVGKVLLECVARDLKDLGVQLAKI